MEMQTKTLIFFLAFFIFNSLSAQSPSFEVAARVFYLPIQDGSINRTLNYSSNLPINDSTAIRSYYAFTRQTIKEYKPELGYELISNIVFPVNNKLSIKTGLGINLSSYSVGPENITNSNTTDRKSVV